MDEVDTCSIMERMSDSNSNVPARITNEETALQWLAANRPNIKIEAGLAIVHRVCNRCLGSGHYSRCERYGTACFECTVPGKPSRWTERVAVKAYAQEQKAKDVRKAKADAQRAAKAEAQLERQRDWCEANGFGRVTFAEKNDAQKAKREQQRQDEKRPAPTGKVEFEGTVISIKESFGAYGASIRMTVKVTTEDGGAWVANGTVPAALLSDGERFGKGCTVKVKATLERGREDSFAFMKRPRAEVVEPVAHGEDSWTAQQQHDRFGY